jgi:UDP-galactopyranose mutase
VRSNDDDRYFTDTYQCMPADGYTAMFQRMLDHSLITFETSVEFESIRQAVEYRHLVYTGPIDAYFDYCYDKLPYRSLEFRHEHRPGVQMAQTAGTVNYPNDFDFTRITEFKHLTGQRHDGTSLVREYPCAHGDPFYPIPTQQNEVLYKRYQALATRCSDVTFVGRLAQYRYYNMDQVVGAAIAAAGHLTTRLR